MPHSTQRDEAVIGDFFRCCWLVPIVFSRPIAQLVEHWSPKPGAVGSSPSWPATTIR